MHYQQEFIQVFHPEELVWFRDAVFPGGKYNAPIRLLCL
jgi:hypothetical protein